MWRANKHTMQHAVLTVVLLLMPFGSFASSESEKRKNDALSLGELAQIGDWAARASRYSLDMLGITDMECECTFTLEEGERMWLFQAEPKIRGIERDGPSHGKLADGDVIVGIDGMLITTRKAGIRFANLVAGEPVELTFRRGRRTGSVTIVPEASPDLDVPVDVTVHRSGDSRTTTIEPGTSAIPELARSIEALSQRAAALGTMLDTLGLPLLPESASFPELDIDFGTMLPEGWIGFGLSFGGSIQHRKAERRAQWRFKAPPSISSIRAGSPADEAGLQVNDVLLEIDGLKLDSNKGGDRFSRMEPGQKVTWKVQRGARTFTVETTARERPRGEEVRRPLPPPVPDALQPVRYTGNLGDTEIEVRGGESVRVEVDEETGEIVIRSRDAIVRLNPRRKR